MTAGRHRRPQSVAADGGAHGRGAAEAGGQPRPGPADRLGPDRGRRPARHVPGGGLDDRTARPRSRPTAAKDDGAGEPFSPGRPTSLPDAGGRGAGRRRPGAPYRREGCRRRAPGSRTADHPQPIIRARLGVSNRAVCELRREFRVVHASRRERAPLTSAAPRRPALPAAQSTARQAPRRRGNLPGRAGRPRVGSRPAPCPVPSRMPAVGPECPRPGARGEGLGRSAEMQTAHPGSRTRRPAAPPANPYSFLGTCQQRSVLSGADAQDAAGINLPADSQTV